MEFQEADINDARVVREIYNEHINAGNSTMDLEKKSLEDVEDWFKEFNSRELIVLLKEDEHVLGWGIIKRYSDRAGYTKTCETAIYLRMSETRKGYGSQMKKWIIDKCRFLGYHHLVAKIFAMNPASIEYNKKLGYEIVGRQKEIGYINDRWQDVIIMQLLL